MENLSLKTQVAVAFAQWRTGKIGTTELENTVMKIVTDLTSAPADPVDKVQEMRISTPEEQAAAAARIGW